MQSMKLPWSVLGGYFWATGSPVAHVLGTAAKVHETPTIADSKALCKFLLSLIIPSLLNIACKLHASDVDGSFATRDCKTVHNDWSELAVYGIIKIFKNRT